MLIELTPCRATWNTAFLQQLTGAVSVLGCRSAGGDGNPKSCYYYYYDY